MHGKRFAGEDRFVGREVVALDDARIGRDALPVRDVDDVAWDEER